MTFRPAVGRRRLALGALILLVGCGLWAGAWGAAALFGLYGDLWAAAGDVPGLDRALAAYSRAARLDGLNAEYLERLGRTLERIGATYPPWSPQAKAPLREAIRNYEKAAALRPTWPYVLPAIARVKLKLGAVDAALGTSLRRAVELGGWSPRVQLEVLDVGLAAWALLDEETRDGVGTVLERALRHTPVPAMDAALDHGRGDLVTPRIEGNEHLQRLFATRRKALSSLGGG